MADSRNVQTARRHVRRDQQMNRPVAEPVQRAGTHRLIQIAVNGGRVETMLFQRLGHHVHIHLAVAEHDGIGAAFALGPDQGPQHGALFGKAAVLAAGGELEQLLFDGQRCRRLTRHLDLGGVGQEGVGDPLDLGGHGGAEEQRLARERRQLEDAFDIGDEPHVQHAVRLVHDHDLNAGQQQLAAFEMIQQTTGRRDQHVNAAVDQLVLFAKGNPADQQRLGQLGVLGIGFEVFGNLCGQFARGRQNKAARHPRTGPTLAQQRDHRQRKAGGLAGAGLGNAQHVAPLQGVRDRLGLNGGGGFVAGFGHGLQHAGVQREIREFCHQRPKGCGVGPHERLGRCNVRAPRRLGQVWPASRLSENAGGVKDAAS